MTSILLVEDDDGKREALMHQIHSSVLDANVVQANSLISALKAIKSHDFDIVVLDITLPYRDIDPNKPPGDMHKLGGEEFLRQMHRLKRPAPVVVVSQYDTFGDEPDVKTFEQLNRELRGNFPDLFYTGIYYHASLSDWSELLDEALIHLQEKTVE